jgi:hypothetical protein
MTQNKETDQSKFVRENPKPLTSGSSYYQRLRVRRAKGVLDRHYRNLLMGGRILYVSDRSDRDPET